MAKPIKLPEPWENFIKVLNYQNHDKTFISVLNYQTHGKTFYHSMY